MTKRMLIDATQPEETRVVVLDGDRVDDFDYDSSSRQSLKGNIYLGKITRVEPSLQAAFVEYGGNRHGFLPFNDIHPDYYRIPIADRESLLAEGDDDDDDGDTSGANGAAAEAPGDSDDQDGDEDTPIETVGGQEDEDTPRARPRLRRHYKIQEVIKRRQIILVQVTKEERGNKGAALTSYISLAGRYSVLMPNALRGGGISRKITNVADRRRLKEVIDSLDVPEGMGVILRTAGLERTKIEIKRDYEFLLRVWDEIRERTLSSRAPAAIYEEASLIKRAIRDTYSQDISQILVEGESAYRAAREFMQALMPSEVDRVVHYKDPTAHLFPRYGVESQLDALHSHTVRLRSGGYIVLNATEALVAIDVNSGRATRERHIEETAVKTNLEAAEEVARQLRLRDLAGIIVIDFIDMEDRRHTSAVERRLKEALKNDRARIQMGRISQLGLLELSRQRLRPSLFETSMVVCPTCAGHGTIRSVESTALYVFRSIEEDVLKRRNVEISVHVPTPVALHLLNRKRHALHALEQANGLRILIECDDTLVGPAFRIEQTQVLEQAALPPAEAQQDLDAASRDQDDAEPEELAAEPMVAAAAAEASSERTAEGERSDDGEGGNGQKRRRRGRRGGRRRGGRRGPDGQVLENGQNGDDDHHEDDDHHGEEDGHDEHDVPVAAVADEEPDFGERAIWRRPTPAADPAPAETAALSQAAELVTSEPDPVEPVSVEPDPVEASQPRAEQAEAATVEEAEVEAPEPVAAEPAAPESVTAEPAAAEPAAAETPAPEPVAEAAPAKPRRTRRTRASDTEAAAEPEAVAVAPEAAEEPAEAAPRTRTPRKTTRAKATTTEAATPAKKPARASTRKTAAAKAGDDAAEKEAPKPRTRRTTKAKAADAATEAPQAAPEPAPVGETTAGNGSAAAAPEPAPAPAEAPATEAPSNEAAPEARRRRGWWQRPAG